MPTGSDGEGVAVDNELAALERATDDKELCAADTEKIILIFTVGENERLGHDVTGSVFSHSAFTVTHAYACRQS